MTGYRMRRENEANMVQLLVRVYGKGEGFQENASTMRERFVQSAALLSEGEYLGWQMAVCGADIMSNMAFSSEGVRIQTEDFAWIFEKYAAVKPCEAGARTEDLFSEGRKVYAFVKRPQEKSEEKSSDGEYGYNYGYSCRYPYSAGKENFADLLEMLQDSGETYLRVVAGASAGKVSGQGLLLLSLPGEISLRMRTALSFAFPSAVVKRVNAPELENLESIPVSDLLDGIVGLQKAFISRKKRKAGMSGVSGGEDSAGDWEEEDEYVYDGEPDETDSCLDMDLSDAPEEEDGLEYVPYTPLESLHLSVRAFNCLKRAGVDSVEELCEMSEDELKGVRNMGRKSLEEIKKAIASKSEPAKAEPAVNYRAMLDGLIGLGSVKEQVGKIEAYARMKQDLEASGRQTGQMVLNMEFVGNPGTAKTTVARILGGIFHEIGLLSSEEIVEVGRTDLVGLYIGHTADRVREVFKKAKGRLLFIDEAYSLMDDRKGSFGDEAINTIVQEMENHRQETIVIFAGYRKEMEEFFSRNPGLRSRTPFRIEFGDYSAGEMARIVELEAEKRGFAIEEQAKEKVTDICGDSKKVENAGNGRFCRNLLEKAILNYAFRVYGQEGAGANRDCVLTEADFTAEGLLEKKKETAPLGFRLRE